MKSFLPSIQVAFWLFGTLLTTLARDSFTLEIWDSERGLPNSTITGVAQSPEGYLWLSTINGLAHFDGARFVTFAGPTQAGLKVGGYNQIAVSKSGEVWARMENGQIVTGNRLGFSTLEVPHSNFVTRAFWTVSDGSVWTSTDDGAIARCSDSRVERLPQSEKFGGLTCAPIALAEGRFWFLTASGALVEWRPNGDLTEIGPTNSTARHWLGMAKDAAENIWLLGENSVWKWRAGQWDLVPFPQSAPKNFKGLKAGKEGSVWFWSEDDLWRIRGGEWRSVMLPQSPVVMGANPNLVLVDQADRIWFGTAGEGLVAISIEGGITRLTVQEGLPSNYVLCLARDHEGNVWCGTRRGLVRIKQTPIKVVLWDHRQSEAVATGLAESHDGRMWIGSDGEGLWRFRDVDDSSKPHSVGNNPKSIRALVCDSRDRLWIGTVREGLWLLDDAGFTNVLATQLPAGEARTLLLDSQEKLWSGGTRGLFSWHDGRLETHSAPANMGLLDVRSLAENGDGSLWVGTQGQGLFRFHDAEWEPVKNSSLTVPAVIWSLYRDRQGDLWIGTGGSGLARFHDGRFDLFNRTNGLTTETIYSILEDDDNQLWLGTHEGIVRISKLECDQVAHGLAARLTPKIFTRVDGLPTLQCASGFQPNACRTRDGRIWFATDKGVVIVDPKNEPAPNRAPNMVIENISQPTGFQPAATEMKIGPLPRNVKIRFTALSFAAPERVKFRYRMEGEDKDWIDLGTERNVTFDTLSPGEHEFHVTACNGDGLWGARGATLKFTVVPIWWQTWWFKGAAAAVVVIVAAGAWWQIASRRLRRRLEEVKRQGAMERERARIARDIHDELGSSLTRIIMLSQPPDEDENVSNEELSRINDTARRLTRSMDEVVWAVNPAQDTLAGLIGYITLFGQEFIESADMLCRLRLPEMIPPVHLSAEVRHNLFLAAKEAINNAVRHSRAKEVTIGLSVKPDHFTIQISDDGVGFDSQKTTTSSGGNGLHNMRERLTAVGGIFEIDRLQPNGTSVKFIMPLPIPAGV